MMTHNMEDIVHVICNIRYVKLIWIKLLKVVNHLTLIILAELLGNKINPTGYINRHGSSPWI